MHSAILFSDTNMIPRYFFFTKGVGKHKEQLQSFELALRDAGIQMCNLVSVSSIVPPACELLTREKGLKLIQPGEITFVVIARELFSPELHLPPPGRGRIPRRKPRNPGEGEQNYRESRSPSPRPLYGAFDVKH